ncbi:hypothetical protein TNIN_419251 [Trichonephila inaurata madagascariensis]|uniref:Uncharacterized protein n=1 Tax=Trichonephila inaurata madagascariensis TaxID=2747483 RepID=A0A8X7C2I2_9ARAC|nr:hypothetical protein TNIN_419251 [Trichonephila inaurata madagascariensis]
MSDYRELDFSPTRQAKICCLRKSLEIQSLVSQPFKVILDESLEVPPTHRNSFSEIYRMSTQAMAMKRRKCCNQERLYGRTSGPVPRESFRATNWSTRKKVHRERFRATNVSPGKKVPRKGLELQTSPQERFRATNRPQERRYPEKGLGATNQSSRKKFRDKGLSKKGSQGKGFRAFKPAPRRKEV